MNKGDIMIYFDNAATTFPKPEKVYEKILYTMKNIGANPGRGSHKMAINLAEEILSTRIKIAKMINCDDEMNIVFTSGATESLNLALKGLLNEGDHVITTASEHNSVLRPLKALNLKGVSITVVPIDLKGRVSLVDIEKEIKRNTKLVVINHVSNVLGTIQDINSIGELCRRKEIIFLVDVCQSLGLLPIDIKKDNIDLLAFSGHKLLYGPQGIGGIYINPNICLKPLKEGGTGSYSNSMVQPEVIPDKFESGTLNCPGILGLGAGIDFINEIGINVIREKELNLCKLLLKELKKLPFIILYGIDNNLYRTGVVSFNIEGMDSSLTGNLLDNENIAVRTGYHCAPLIHSFIGTINKGTVRVSLGYFNEEEHIEVFIKALKKIYKNI